VLKADEEMKQEDSDDDEDLTDEQFE